MIPGWDIQNPNKDLIAINKAVEPLRHKLLEKSPVWISKEILQTVHSAEHIDNIIDASKGVHL